MKRLRLLLLGLAGAAGPAAAQTLLPKPSITKPTAIVGPASLTATGGVSSILLTFGAVSGADGYRVTRTNNAGEPETVIFTGGLGSFAFQGVACVPPQGCAYTDAAVSRGFLYSYRVYALYGFTTGTPTVSPPSPVASAQLKLAKPKP